MLSSIRSEPTLSRLAGMGWVSPDRRFIDSSIHLRSAYLMDMGFAVSCKLPGRTSRAIWASPPSPPHQRVISPLLPGRRQFTQNVVGRLLEGCSRDILIRAILSSQFD